jgi:hypothetical protein
MSVPYEGDSTNASVPGLKGKGSASIGVLGQSDSNSGMVGTSGTGQGVTAFSDNNVAIFGRGGTFAGVFEGAFVVNKGPGRADHKPDPIADPINGSIVINDGNLFVNKGDVILATAADCAEYFDIGGPASAEPGSVMVITEEGALELSTMAYDTRVAGIVSGAGDCRPGILLDGQRLDERRLPIALMGKVYCKVNADAAPVSVGDMLTTSAMPGYAMRASDPAKAFGAVIGKALRPLRRGLGLIPVLVALQ